MEVLRKPEVKKMETERDRTRQRERKREREKRREHPSTHSKIRYKTMKVHISGREIRATYMLRHLTCSAAGHGHGSTRVRALYGCASFVQVGFRKVFPILLHRGFLPR